VKCFTELLIGLVGRDITGYKQKRCVEYGSVVTWNTAIIIPFVTSSVLSRIIFQFILFVWFLFYVYIVQILARANKQSQAVHFFPSFFFQYRASGKVHFIKKILSMPFLP
jgi:hypothetical protein